MKFIFSVNTSLITEDDTECNLKKKKALKANLCSFKKDQHHILMLNVSQQDFYFWIFQYNKVSNFLATIFNIL